MHEMDVLEFPGPADWESWLEEHHDVRTHAWLRIGKRSADLELIAIGDALDAALCFGWIDGQRRAYDEASFQQRYSRRRPSSAWSKVNVGKVEALLAAGRMRPAGLATLEAARVDGRWAAAYESQRNAIVPPDLAAALARDDRASARFERLGRSERYAVMLPVLKARTQRTREAEAARAVARLHCG